MAAFSAVLVLVATVGLLLAATACGAASAGAAKSVPISFVTQYLDPVGQKSFIFHQLAKANKTIPAKYLMVLDSARAYHKDAKAVVFTDKQTSFSHAAAKNLTIVRGQKFRLVGRAMVARYEAWADYVRAAIEAGDENHIVFVDDDVIFTGDVSHVFEPGLGPGPLLVSKGGSSGAAARMVSDWAVGLTYCNGSQERLETGVVFVHGKRLKEALEFFDRAVNQTVESRTERSTWFPLSTKKDKQLLAHLVDKAAVAGTEAPAAWYYTASVDGMPILLLPCTKYNYMPRKHDRTGEDLVDVKVVQLQAISPIAMWRIWRDINAGKGLEAAFAILPKGGHVAHEHFKVRQHIGGRAGPP